MLHLPNNRFGTSRLSSESEVEVSHNLNVSEVIEELRKHGNTSIINSNRDIPSNKKRITLYLCVLCILILTIIFACIYCWKLRRSYYTRINDKKSVVIDKQQHIDGKENIEIETKEQCDQNTNNDDEISLNNENN